MSATTLLRILRPAITFLITIVGAGCFPVINHGPRIEEGRSFGAVGAYPLASRDSQPVLASPLGLNLGGGWGAENPTSAGYFLGLHVPFPGLWFSQLDVYRQAAAATLEGFDLGIGASVGVWQAMPYVQFGRAGPGGSGWHTTQGVIVVHNSTKVQDLAQGWAWIPGAAYRWVSPDLAVELFVTGVYGRYPRSCREPCEAGQSQRQLTVGGSVTAKRPGLREP